MSMKASEGLQIEIGTDSADVALYGDDAKGRTIVRALFPFQADSSESLTDVRQKAKHEAQRRLQHMIDLLNEDKP